MKAASTSDREYEYEHVSTSPRVRVCEYEHVSMSPRARECDEAKDLCDSVERSAMFQAEGKIRENTIVRSVRFGGVTIRKRCRRDGRNFYVLFGFASGLSS